MTNTVPTKQTQMQTQPMTFMPTEQRDWLAEAGTTKTNSTDADTGEITTSESPVIDLVDRNPKDLDLWLRDMDAWIEENEGIGHCPRCHNERTPEEIEEFDIFCGYCQRLMDKAFADD